MTKTKKTLKQIWTHSKLLSCVTFEWTLGVFWVHIQLLFIINDPLTSYNTSKTWGGRERWFWGKIGSFWALSGSILCNPDFSSKLSILELFLFYHEWSFDFMQKMTKIWFASSWENCCRRIDKWTDGPCAIIPKPIAFHSIGHSRYRGWLINERKYKHKTISFVIAESMFTFKKLFKITLKRNTEVFC